MDWSELYPAYKIGSEATEASPEQMSSEEPTDPSPIQISKAVEVADIGCGFGGLLFALAPVLSDTLLLGRSPRRYPLGPRE